MITDALEMVLHKDHVKLTSRCNEAIMAALSIAKQEGFTRVYIPDIGGWLTYKPYAKKLGFEVIEIKTLNGYINSANFTPEPHSVLLCHSLAGYHTKQDTKKLFTIMKESDGLFIEDICGIIGHPAYGDILVCSFGHWKPIDFGTGGCIATNNAQWIAQVPNFDAPFATDAVLFHKIEMLDERYEFLYAVREKVKDTFSAYNPIADEFGLVVLVPFASEDEKKNIISTCDSHGWEYELCPRNIRSDLNAVCVEVKRLVLE